MNYRANNIIIIKMFSYNTQRPQTSNNLIKKISVKSNYVYIPSIQDINFRY